MTSSSVSVGRMRRPIARWLVAAVLVAGAVPACGGSSAKVDERSAYEGHCRAACERQGSCLDNYPADECKAGCANLDRAYSEECIALYDSVLSCQSSLSCEGVRSFADDPRGHAECGTAYSAFQASCGYPGGAPPAECESYCDAIERCVPDRYYGGCADGCAQSIVVFGNMSGQACADAYQRTNGCLGGLTCTNFALLFEPTPTVPAGCETETLEFVDACR